MSQHPKTDCGGSICRNEAMCNDGFDRWFQSLKERNLRKITITHQSLGAENQDPIFAISELK